MKKKNLIACLLILCTEVLASVSSADSIRRKMEHLQGEELLLAYSNLCALAFAQDDFENECACLNDYIAEARRQRSIKDETDARLALLVCYYNYDKTERMLAELPIHLEFLAGHGMWVGYYNAWNQLVDLYIYQNKYRMALQVVEEIYTDARARNSNYGLGVASYGMGDVYHHMQNTEESAKAYAEAIRRLANADDLTILMYAYENYSEVLDAAGKYDTLRQLTGEWLAKLDALKERYLKKGYDPKGLDSKYRYCYQAMARTEMETGNLTEAYRLLRMADDLTRGNPPIARLALLRDYARYYELTRDYDKALACNDERLQLNLSSGNSRGVLDAWEQRATLLMAAGRYMEAARLYRDILPVRDSLASVHTAGRLDELNTIHKLDELVLTNKITATRFYFALVSAGLLSLIVLLYILYTRRLRRKNRVLYESILQSQKIKESIESSAALVPEEQLGADEKLYRKLCHLMREETLYTDAQLKRETLAERLHTNHVYIANAVRKCAGDITVGEFINGYRLRYAAGLLTGSPELNISEVEYMSGFNSRTTFSRLFRDYYGMSPTEYRTISREKRRAE